MDRFDLPYQPLRAGLYSAAELYLGFVDGQPGSFVDTTDFRTYRHYVRSRHGRSSYFETMMQSLHDHSIGRALHVFLEERKCVAIMGGHKLARASAVYGDVARLSRLLTRRGFTLASGGGPGAMEATHLGATFAALGPARLETALQRLRNTPPLPDASGLVARDGRVGTAVARRLHRFLRPAAALAASVSRAPASIAMPTWHYGHEPTTPFATHVAKYFQNSLREDGLLAIATYGVIFAPGKAGTLQEVFQDAAQNYYVSHEWRSPMVLLGVDYWTRTFPVVPVLRELFGRRYERIVRVVDDVREAAAFIEAFEPPGRRPLPRRRLERS